MTTADYINLATALIPSMGVIVSLIIAVLTLRQSSKQAKEFREMNEKMVEESTRPYLYLFLRPNFNASNYGRLVLKNFGRSAANIRSVKLPNISLMPQLDDKADAHAFSNIENSTFPPGYEMETSFQFDINHDNPFYELEIEYASDTHSYREILRVNLRQGVGTYKVGPSSGRKYAEYISESLQVIAQSLYTKV